MVQSGRSQVVLESWIALAGADGAIKFAMSQYTNRSEISTPYYLYHTTLHSISNLSSGMNIVAQNTDGIF